MVEIKAKKKKRQLGGLTPAPYNPRRISPEADERQTCGGFGGKTAKGAPCKRASFDGGMCGEHQGIWKAGRPPRDIDAGAVRRLAEIGCTYEEMAYILGAKRHTISERFADVVRTGSAKTKASLRRAQLMAALGDQERGTQPNITMQIWLGKQMLGQSDKQEVTGRDGSPFQVTVRAMSDQELMGYAALLDLGVEVLPSQCSGLLPAGDGEDEP